MTEQRRKAGIGRLQENLRLGRPILILSAGVLLPVLLSTSVGLISMLTGSTSEDMILGALVVSLTAAAVGSGIVVAVLLGKRAKIARLQSDLLCNVTHELKTPLAAIRLFGQTLQMGLVDHDPKLIKTCADSIVRETEWLAAMIERILTWRTRAEDRDNLEMELDTLQEAGQRAVERFSRMLPPGEVIFHTCIDTGLPVLHDKECIVSVLVNLLTNAYKYTGIRKEIWLDVKDSDEHVVLEVRDNGPGVPDNEVKRIFQPFYRVNRGSGIGGAGLGLAIVDMLVKAHSGSIVVRSRQGQGTTFRVLLPAADAGETSDHG